MQLKQHFDPKTCQETSLLRGRNCILAMPGPPKHAIEDDPKARLYGRPVLVYHVRVMQRLWRFNGKCVCAWGYDIPEPVITVSWGKLHISIELVSVESAVCNPKAAQAEMCRKCKLKIGFRQLLQRATQLKLFLQYSPVAAPWKFTHTLHMGTWLLVLVKKSQKCWKWELIDAARY